MKNDTRSTHPLMAGSLRAGSRLRFASGDRLLPALNAWARLVPTLLAASKLYGARYGVDVGVLSADGSDAVGLAGPWLLD